MRFIRETIFIPLLAVCMPAWSQSSMNGLIADPRGAAIPMAQVEARNLLPNINRVVQTSIQGCYTISALTPGTYTVHVEAAGFTGLQRTGVVLGEN